MLSYGRVDLLIRQLCPYRRHKWSPEINEELMGCKQYWRWRPQPDIEKQTYFSQLAQVKSSKCWIKCRKNHDKYKNASQKKKKILAISIENIHSVFQFLICQISNLAVRVYSTLFGH